MQTEDDSHSVGDDDERLKELYEKAKAELKADALSHRLDELFSLESAVQKKTVWGFKAAKRLLKNALEQPDLETITAHYRQLMLYANAVTSNDFERCISKIVNLSANLSQTEVLRALFSVSSNDVTLTSVSARTAIKLAQSLVRLQSNGSTLGCLVDLQHRLEDTSDVPTMTKNRCLLELYVLEMELFWRIERFENMDAVYCKALSTEDAVIGLQQMTSAHGYYGRYLLRCDRPAEALEYLVKAVKDETSIADEHHTACVQSLALVAYTSNNHGAGEMLDGYGGRLDVAAIRRFAAAFFSSDVAALEQTLYEIEGTFEDREIRRLLRHYETVLKRKLYLKTSSLPSDCWADILQCLTHSTWHDLQTLCRKFDPILAPLLQHLHSDVQRTRFEHSYSRWHVTLYSKSSRQNKVVHYERCPGDAVLANAAMQDVFVVEMRSANAVTDEGIVRFCFGRDGRRLEIRKPQITRRLFARLVEEHLSAANDHEFTLIVTFSSDSYSEIRRQSTAAHSQSREQKTDFSCYEFRSGTSVLTIELALSVRDLDTMTVVRRRLAS
ncbi:PCI domain-containing protein [Aphelenchoides avenae]|nr:PCI domain-containing protein [Aphelenchus avenae]